LGYNTFLHAAWGKLHFCPARRAIYIGVFMKYLFFIFWIIVIILGVTFASLNSHTVDINYYVNSSSIHLPILLLITLVLGAILGCIAMLPTVIRGKHANHRLKHRVKQIEQEVNNLRTIPIKETH
jgi:lipopolysaccharide assembly protein A